MENPCNAQSLTHGWAFVGGVVVVGVLSFCCDQQGHKAAEVAPCRHAATGTSGPSLTGEGWRLHYASKGGSMATYCTTETGVQECYICSSWPLPPTAGL